MCNVQQLTACLQPVYSIIISRNFVSYKCLLSLPVSIYIVFRHAHPDNATMEDVKKALRDNDIDFNRLEDCSTYDY